MSVTVHPFDPAHHRLGSVSADAVCGQGGRDTCTQVPEFSVVGDHYRVAACQDHIAGALRQALELPARG